jgi:hypothetical protein
MKSLSLLVNSYKVQSPQYFLQSIHSTEYSVRKSTTPSCEISISFDLP